MTFLMKKFWQIGLIILISSCSIFDVEKNEIINELANPIKNKKAIVFLKGGNATADNSVQIILSGIDFNLKNLETGNIFIADTNYGKADLENSVRTIWPANDTLIVEFDKSLRVFKKETILDGVTIIYTEK